MSDAAAESLSKHEGSLRIGQKLKRQITEAKQRLKDEKKRLKDLVAELTTKNRILKHVTEGNS